jgi:hypothetical protein
MNIKSFAVVMVNGNRAEACAHEIHGTDLAHAVQQATLLCLPDDGDEIAMLVVASTDAGAARISVTEIPAAHWIDLGEWVDYGDLVEPCDGAKKCQHCECENCYACPDCGLRMCIHDDGDCEYAAAAQHSIDNCADCGATKTSHVNNNCPES